MICYYWPNNYAAHIRPAPRWSDGPQNWTTKLALDIDRKTKKVIQVKMRPLYEIDRIWMI